MRVEFDRGNGYADCTRRALVSLLFGWRFEAWGRWERPLCPRFGVGFYLGEPWAYEGRLWGVAFTFWAATAGIGIRGAEPELWFNEDEESPDAP